MSTFRYDQLQYPHPMGGLQQFVHAESHPVSTIPAAELNVVKEQAGAVLSVVVPAHDEAASLAQLVEEIIWALRPLCHCTGGLGDFEIIIIDDGSTDSTRSVLADLASVHAELRWLALANQVGQTAATSWYPRLRGEIGLRPWMLTCKTIQLIWQGSGLLYPETTRSWAGGLNARTSGLDG